MKKPVLCLRQRLFPHGRISQVPLAQIRTFLLDLFQQWGLPKAIRTDNGEPFGVPTRDVVPMVSLWLLAWGIQPILNRPRHPQENAKVERNQATAGNWAEVYVCANVANMQAKLDDVVLLQREYYPVRKLQGATRNQVFPALNRTQRPFDPSTFDAQKAQQYLQQVVYPRKVSANGVISLYQKTFSVGLPHRAKIVFVTFDPQNIAWMVLDQYQSLLKSIPDDRFSQQKLFLLNVCQ